MHHPPSVADQQKIAELDGHEIRLQRLVAELDGHEIGLQRLVAEL